MAINTTPNLHLPQWTPNEKPAYLTDFNQAFASIDTGFAGVQQGSAGAVQTATNAYNQATQALQTANQAQSSANKIIQGMHYSAISLPTTPGPNLQSFTVTLIYNLAGGVFVIGIVTKPEITQGEAFIGTFTIPNNFESVGFNNRNALTNFIKSGTQFLEEINFTTTDEKIVTMKLGGGMGVFPNSWYYQVTIPIVGTVVARSNKVQYQVLPTGRLSLN